MDLIFSPFLYTHRSQLERAGSDENRETDILTGSSEDVPLLNVEHRQQCDLVNELYSPKQYPDYGTVANLLCPF